MNLKNVAGCFQLYNTIVATLKVWWKTIIGSIVFIFFL